MFSDLCQSSLTRAITVLLILFTNPYDELVRHASAKTFNILVAWISEDLFSALRIRPCQHSSAFHDLVNTLLIRLRVARTNPVITYDDW